MCQQISWTRRQRGPTQNSMARFSKALFSVFVDGFTAIMRARFMSNCCRPIQRGGLLGRETPGGKMTSLDLPLSHLEKNATANVRLRTEGSLGPFAKPRSFRKRQGLPANRLWCNQGVRTISVARLPSPFLSVFANLCVSYCPRIAYETGTRKPINRSGRLSALSFSFFRRAGEFDRPFPQKMKRTIKING